MKIMTDNRGRNSNLIMGFNEDDLSHIGTYLNIRQVGLHYPDKPSAGANVNKYLSKKTHTFYGDVWVRVPFKGNLTCDRLEQAVKAGEQLASERKNLALIARLNIEKANTLSEDQINRISKIIKE